jgi:hypothetical protein
MGGTAMTSKKDLDRYAAAGCALSKRDPILRVVRAVLPGSVRRAFDIASHLCEERPNETVNIAVGALESDAIGWHAGVSLHTGRLRPSPLELQTPKPLAGYYLTMGMTALPRDMQARILDRIMRDGAMKVGARVAMLARGETEEKTNLAVWTENLKAELAHIADFMPRFAVPQSRKEPLATIAEPSFGSDYGWRYTPAFGIGIPGMPSIPNVNMPNVPGTIPGAANLLGVSNLPGAANLPGIPNLPGVSNIPGALASDANSGIAQAQAAAQSVGIDWDNAAGSMQSALNAEASPAVQAQIQNAAQEAVTAATSGKPLSDAQIKGIFTTAATAAAVIGGVGASVAGSVFAPIAAFVFGGGYLMGDAVKKIFHITGHSPVMCGPDDHTHYGSSPSDPAWKSWASFVNKTLSDTAKFYHVPVPNTAPDATTGSFENYARPALIHLYELQLNCKAPPWLSATGVPGGAYKMLLGLAQTWNAANPSAPQKTIKWVGDAALSAHRQVTAQEAFEEYDPIQWALQDGKLFLSFGPKGPPSTFDPAHSNPGSLTGPPISITVTEPQYAPGTSAAAAAAPEKPISLHALAGQHSAGSSILTTSTEKWVKVTTGAVGGGAVGALASKVMGTAFAIPTMIGLAVGGIATDLILRKRGSKSCKSCAPKGAHLGKR